MPVVIGQIVTETVVAPAPTAAAPAAGSLSDEQIDTIVRRASERVLDVLKREWDR